MNQLSFIQNKARMPFVMWLLTLMVTAVWAQGPHNSGTYYQAANGKKGAELKTALCRVINPHTQRAYTDLWTDFQTTDKREDGKVWDVYSNITNYTFVTDQDKGDHQYEGATFNREHSFPKSWWGGTQDAMYTDLFHLYPSDSYVNEQRNNYPFGENRGDVYMSNGGFSKLGYCTMTGYDGIVFEPNDEYKGDFARTYFYMVTCYENEIESWTVGQAHTLDGQKYPGLQEWQLNMLRRWAKNDPVSQKEINRNEAVYGIQSNRNPFIDYPGLEEYIWGDSIAVAFSYDNYGAGSAEGGDDTGTTTPTVTVLTVADAVAMINAGTNTDTIYVQGIISKIDSYSASYGTINYWISADGTTTSQQFQIYNGFGMNGAKFTSKNDIVVGAQVVVRGFAKRYNTTYELDRNGYLVEYKEPELAAPVLNDGWFVESHRVTMVCVTEGATIYYTTDGSEPTARSTCYTGPFMLTSSMTIKAVAIKDGVSSAVTTGEYVCVESIANTQATAYTVAQALELISQKNAQTLVHISNKVYVHGVVKSVQSLDTGTYGNANYFITDDGSNELYIYRGLGMNGEKFTTETADNLTVGNTVTIYGNLQYYNNTTPEMTANNYLVEVASSGTTNPGPEDITLEVASGSDIYEALSNATAGKDVGDIVINLQQNGRYTVSNSLIASHNITINGNGAVIDASNSGKAFMAMKKQSNDTWTPVEVEIADVTINGLSNSLFWNNNNLYYQYNMVLVKNSVINVASNIAYPLLDFRMGSAVLNVNIHHSTFYAPYGTSNAFFSSQNSQSVAAIESTAQQTFVFADNTVYNMAKGYTFFVHGQNSQPNQYYEIKNNLFMDCGMKGQVVIGFNGGVASGYPAWGVFGNVFNYEGLDSSADEIANDTNGKIQNTIAGVMNFNDVSAGDFGGIFNLAANVSAPKSLGDPRWTISYMESSTPDSVNVNPEPSTNPLLISFTENDVFGSGMTGKHTYADGDFVLTTVDDNGKHAIDNSSAYFGRGNDVISFSYRYKTGGKSSSASAMTLSIPADGTLRIYARSGNSTATDRTVELLQNGVMISSTYVTEENAVTVADPTGMTYMLYQPIEVSVSAGTVDVTYPVNAINFYGFELLPQSEVTPDDPGTDPNPDTLMGDVDGNGQVNVTDAVLVIDYILSKNPKTFNAAVADVNHDGIINVTDVVIIIDAILGKIVLK